MRRTGRRIEIWQINEASGAFRKKPGARSYSERWDPTDVVEVEIKLDVGTTPPEFILYAGDRGPQEFKDLEAARKRVEKLATELADARAGEDWIEVILVAGRFWSDHEKVEAFGVSFYRALVAEERARYWKRDAYGPAESTRRLAPSHSIPFSEALWAELREWADLEEWIAGKLAGRDLEEDEELEDVDLDGKVGSAFLLRYWRGRARLIRDLRDGATRRVPRREVDDD